MAVCKGCLYFGRCDASMGYNEPACGCFKDRSQFVELKSAEWIEDEDMYGDPIFRCSNCEARFVLEEGTPEDNEYYYCPTCGAKMTLKGCEENA